MGGLMTLSAGASAQSLYLTTELAEDGPEATTAPVMYLEEVSLTYIPEPEVRTYQKHDIITIVIDEVSSQTSSQKLETEKESQSTVEIDAMIDLLKLLELQLNTNPRLANRTIFDASASREFTGEGDYEREDRFSARITATVIDVKPNGTLVLEAQKRIQKDDEIQTLVIAGVARTEDITNQNTVLSSQLAGLSLAVQNEGDLKDAAKKGIITEFFDTLFAF
ncbi:MAG: flagellar basal body L-ring protein FlgH [Phycisphaerales bacterium]|nr:flagellar basal body L-ring protein FlgH [Phycisphaerales bacterium]